MHYKKERVSRVGAMVTGYTPLDNMAACTYDYMYDIRMGRGQKSGEHKKA